MHIKKKIKNKLFRLYFFILKPEFWRLFYRIYYINGADILPPPLSAEEEKLYLSQLSGDSAAARKVLVERNLRLVVYIAKKFENTAIDVEDLISIGTIGLIKSVNTFLPDKNIKLATYASRCIENEILMYLRKNTYIRSEISIEEPLNVDWDGNELLLCDILGTENDTVHKDLDHETDRQLLKTALGCLNGREQRIMQLRFGLFDGRERTQKEVADALGISQSYISRLEKKILIKLRKEINKMV